MRLTAFTDYALRLLIHLGRDAGRLCTIAEVAQQHGIAHSHLTKVTHLLAQAGLVETLRGRGGGMRLARPAASITLGEVVRLTETDFALVECFSGTTACRLDGACGLAGVLDGALAAFLETLDRRTLADVLPADASVVRIARRPRAAGHPAPLSA